MSNKASNDVIKQAHSLRQYFKINFNRTIFGKRPLQITMQEYEFKSLDSIRSLSQKKKNNHLPKLNFSLNPVEKIAKHHSEKRNPCYQLNESFVSRKTLEIPSSKSPKENYFIEKKKKFALHLHLPVAECRPSSKESIISKSSTLIHY